MSLYKARSRVVEAFNIQDWNMAAVAEWCGATIVYSDDLEGGFYFEVDTVMGDMDAYVGDIIARDSDGQMFVLDSERFIEEFEMVA